MISLRRTSFLGCPLQSFDLIPLLFFSGGVSRSLDGLSWLGLENESVPSYSSSLVNALWFLDTKGSQSSSYFLYRGLTLILLLHIVLL